MAAIASMGGLALSAYGTYQGSQANKAAFGAQAQVAANNKIIADYQAGQALERGERAASDAGIRKNQLKGQQRARLAANGVDLGVGSAQEILTDTDYFGEIDQQRIRDNAAREAWGYRTQGANFGADASLMRSRADGEKPMLAAGTTLLTGASRVAGDWYSSGGGRYKVPTYEGAEY